MSKKSIKNEIDAIYSGALNLLQDLKYVTDVKNPQDIYVEFMDENDVIQLLNFNSDTFRCAVRNAIREEFSLLVLPDLKPIFDIIRDERTSFSKVAIHTRFASNTKEIVYALHDTKNHYVVISDKDVKICEDSKFYFCKKNNLPQPLPQKNNKNLAKLLKKYVNIQDDDYKLYLVYLCHLFIPSISHFIGVINAPPGSGKTTFSNLTKSLVDPTYATNSLVPKSTDELIVHLCNNYMVNFDNARQLKDDESDIICAAITGTTQAKRTLYTTADETILHLKNIILINGIDILPKNADFIERSILLPLAKLDSEKITSESELTESFEREKPLILYAIFNTISKALEIRKTLKPQKSHRLCDAYNNMCAIAIALGFTLDEFQKIFEKNKRKLESSYVENNEFVSAVVDFMSSRKNKSYTATMTEAYVAIKHWYNGRNFPKSSSAFSRKLASEIPVLHDHGYEILRSEKRDCTYLTINKK